MVEATAAQQRAASTTDTVLVTPSLPKLAT